MTNRLLQDITDKIRSGEELTRAETQQLDVLFFDFITFQHQYEEKSVPETEDFFKAEENFVHEAEELISEAIPMIVRIS